MKIRAGILWTVARVSGMAIAVLLVLIVIYGLFWGSRHFIVRHHAIFYDDLPAEFDGYRILQFSDLHYGTFRESDMETLVNIINRQQCDMVVFTGDIVNRRSSELDGCDRLFSRIQAPDGVYSILGNHDYGTYSDMQETEQKADVERLVKLEIGYGWIPLLNDHRKIHRGSKSIVIAGVENYGNPPFPQYGDLGAALKGVKKSDFIVLLSHDPAHWRAQILSGSSVQLTLSGHTHAAQFKIWGWSPIAMKYDEWSGLYQEGDRVLNVSEGLGGMLGPFRYGAWPEVSVITLRKIQK